MTLCKSLDDYLIKVEDMAASHGRQAITPTEDRAARLLRLTAPDGQCIEISVNVIRAAFSGPDWQHKALPHPIPGAVGFVRERPPDGVICLAYLRLLTEAVLRGEARRAAAKV